MYKNAHDSTEQKILRNRNHLGDYFLKERGLDRIIRDYSYKSDWLIYSTAVCQIGWAINEF